MVEKAVRRSQATTFLLAALCETRTLITAVQRNREHDAVTAHAMLHTELHISVYERMVWHVQPLITIVR